MHYVSGPENVLAEEFSGRNGNVLIFRGDVFLGGGYTLDRVRQWLRPLDGHEVRIRYHTSRPQDMDPQNPGLGWSYRWFDVAGKVIVNPDGSVDVVSREHGATYRCRDMEIAYMRTLNINGRPPADRARSPAEQAFVTRLAAECEKMDIPEFFGSCREFEEIRILWRGERFGKS
jgi:hypothetical protein